MYFTSMTIIIYYYSFTLFSFFAGMIYYHSNCMVNCLYSFSYIYQCITRYIFFRLFRTFLYLYVAYFYGRCIVFVLFVCLSVCDKVCMCSSYNLDGNSSKLCIHVYNHSRICILLQQFYQINCEGIIAIMTFFIKGI